MSVISVYVCATEMKLQMVMQIIVAEYFSTKVLKYTCMFLPHRNLRFEFMHVCVRIHKAVLFMPHMHTHTNDKRI
jgi:hypothetical protein